MADLYLEPVFYGVQDVVITGGRHAWVIFPSDDGAVFTAPIRSGKYPLVVFVHGSRDASTRDESNSELCPPDTSQDYKAWLPVLHLLARCGFVVVAPYVMDVLDDDDIDRGAEVVGEVVTWMRTHWRERSVLWYPPANFVDPIRAKADPLHKDLQDSPVFKLGAGIGGLQRISEGARTPVGLVGHSWGARACARAAANVGARAIASIAGSFDDTGANRSFVDAMLPTLMIAGSEDFQAASYLPYFWNALTWPKHQALLQGIGHWDWFGGSNGWIHLCDDTSPQPACTLAWFTAAELLLGFMTKHLNNQWSIPPYLLGPSGDRVPLLPYYSLDMACALKVRWNDRQAQGGAVVSDVTFGNWTAFSPW